MTPSQEIDKQIADLPDWRGKTMATLRRVVHEADPDIVEEVKWKKPSKPEGTAVWSHDGRVLIVNAFKNKVNMTFEEGAKLPDSKKLFNWGKGNKWRGIDFKEGDKIDEAALKSLVRAAVAFNVAKKKKK